MFIGRLLVYIDHSPSRGSAFMSVHYEVAALVFLAEPRLPDSVSSLLSP